jgi:hypothetical protein
MPVNPFLDGLLLMFVSDPGGLFDLFNIKLKENIKKLLYSFLKVCFDSTKFNLEWNKGAGFIIER